jgi:hypothetical protein
VEVVIPAGIDGADPVGIRFILGVPSGGDFGGPDGRPVAGVSGPAELDAGVKGREVPGG